MKNSNMPAMPIFSQHGCVRGAQAGLTKREHIAAMMMQGVVNHTTIVPDLKYAAKRAVHAADLLLKALDE